MYTYVYLQSMAGQQRFWVEVGPGSAFTCRLMDFNQYQGFISGNEVTFEEFQLTSILNEISVPRSGDWYVVMQGQGTYEVMVPPAPIADKYLPTLPWVNTTDKSILGSPESHGQSQWQSKYENLAASQDKLPESLAPMFKPPKNAPDPLDSAKEQAQRVDQARADLEKAQADFTGKLVSAYMGEKNNDAFQAAEKLFETRRALVAATRELEQSNLASFAVGRSPVPVPELPPDVYIQSFPPGESVIESLGKVNSKVSAATFGLIPDIPADYRTATDWEDASTGEKINLAIDIVGLIPGIGQGVKVLARISKWVGGKFVGWIYKVFQKLKRTPVPGEISAELLAKYKADYPAYLERKKREGRPAREFDEYVDSRERWAKLAAQGTAEENLIAKKYGFTREAGWEYQYAAPNGRKKGTEGSRIWDFANEDLSKAVEVKSGAIGKVEFERQIARDLDMIKKQGWEVTWYIRVPLTSGQMNTLQKLKSENPKFDFIVRQE